MRDCVILGGSSHPDLVARICHSLDVQPAEVTLGMFSNGETSVQIHDTVREKTVFVVQSACGDVNDSLLELMIMISACKSASAKSVNAVLPLFPYSRQLDARDARARAINAPGFGVGSDSQHSVPVSRNGSLSGTDTTVLTPPPSAVSQPSPRKVPTTFGEDLSREATPVPDALPGMIPPRLVPPRQNGPVSHSSVATPATSYEDNNIGYRTWMAQSGALVAALLTNAGADHVVTLDLHDPHFQGFFDIPVDNLYFRPSLIQFVSMMIPNFKEAVVVSPDAGGAKRATAVADSLHARFALIHKDRRNNATLLVGDVANRVVIIVDDLVDSGRTMMRAAKVVKDHGAEQVWAICSHGLFSGGAIHKIRRSAIDHVVTTNSVPQDQHKAILGDRLHVVDVSHIFAEAIRRIYNGESISMLFEHQIGVL